MRTRRKKRLSLPRGVMPPASGRDQAWSMDFVHDQLVTGRSFRVLTVIDQWSRESVLMEAKVALTGQSVDEKHTVYTGEVFRRNLKKFTFTKP